MPSAGISVHPDCIEAFNELKMGKNNLKYIIYALSSDMKEFVVDEKGPAQEGGSKENFEAFKAKLEGKKDPNNPAKMRPSLAVYDLDFELAEGGRRTKITFITYIDQDNTAIKSRMVYASSREGLKSALSGIALDLQANDKSELEYQEILEKASKGKALA